MDELNPLKEELKYYTTIRIGPYKRESNFKLSAFEPKMVVKLPIPTELRDDTTVSYTPVNLETVGDALASQGEFNAGLMNAAGLRSGGNVLNSVLGGGPKGIASMVKDRGIAAKIGGYLGGGYLGMIQALLPPEQINSAIQQLSGVAPNPNPSVQFQGPVLRDFTFTWAFYPKNKGESENISKMIKMLKARALPSYLKGNSNAVLEYPHICQVNFMPWDREGEGNPSYDSTYGWCEKSIIRMKRCFMAGVNVNYNAFGTPSFFEGTSLPTSYQLTINFREIEYLLSNDWDKAAEKERYWNNVQEEFSIADVLSNQLNILSSTAGGIAQGIVLALGDALDLTEPNAVGAEAQAQADKIEAGSRDTQALKPNEANTYVTRDADGNIVQLNQIKLGEDGKYRLYVVAGDKVVETKKETDGRTVTTYSIKKGESFSEVGVRDSASEIVDYSKEILAEGTKVNTL